MSIAVYGQTKTFGDFVALYAVTVSLPTGKLNTFGNHTLPDAVIVKVRTARPISFVGACEKPCRAEQEIGGHVREACQRLAD